MPACQIKSGLDECLNRARKAIVPMCRSCAKRLRRDPDEIVADVLEKIYLRLSSGQPIVNIVRYARRYARGWIAQARLKQRTDTSFPSFDREGGFTAPLDRLIASEEREVIHEEIESLSAADQQIVLAMLNDEPPPTCYRDMIPRRMQALARLRERLAHRGIEE